ncbi:unnamed protein product, partial [Discosporangium mesarthrocarpum]
HRFCDHRDFIYCMDFIPQGGVGEGRGKERGGILVTGGGDGVLLVHDLSDLRLLYGLGCCSKGAVRCVVAKGGMDGRLVVGGDDGNAMLYDFPPEDEG